MIRKMATVIAIVGSACATERDTPVSTSDDMQLEACHGQRTDSFVLGNLSVHNDELLIRVATGGGCAQHSFSICWDGAILDSNPPQADLALFHNAHGDTCDALLMHDVRADVSAIRAKFAPPVVVHVTGAIGQLEGTVNSATLD